MNPGESSEEDDLYKEEKISAERYSKSLSVYESALALDKPKGIWRVIKIPGIVFVGGVSGYLLGYFGFGPWVIIPLLYALAFVFMRRIKEFKRSIEAFVYFSIRKKSASKYEKVNWMNEVMEKTWRYVESTASKIILLKASAILRTIKVPMISDVRLDRFTLGGQPPVIEGIRIRKSDKESLIMDISMYFIPTTMEEHKSVLESAGLEGRETDWNSNITLTVRVGSGMAGMDIPLTLKNISFKGSVRIKLKLTYDTSVIEGVEFSFLKQPTIGFNIVPLKIVDIMDIPGLATAIKKVIALGIQKEALYPKKISVALKPRSIYYVGVIMVHIHRIQTTLEGEYFLSIGLNGRKSTHITRVTDPNCNYMAYIPIKNLDDLLFVSIRRKEEDSSIATATISIEQICMEYRIQRILPISNSLGYMDLSAAYYPKIDVDRMPEEEKPKSAIVTVKIAQLIDMVDATGKPYKNLLIKGTAYLREKRPKQKDPADMSAAELMTTESHSPAPIATNESSTESEEEGKKYKTTVLTDEILGTFKTKTSREVISPGVDEKFVFFTRDTKRTMLILEAYDNTRLLGSFSVNIRRGIRISYGTFDFWHLNAGKAKVIFSAEYACLPKVKMNKYTHIRAIRINKIEPKGVYSGYIVTRGRVVNLPEFFSHGTGNLRGYVLVPILSTEEVSKVIIYHENEVFGGCDVISGDTFLGGDTPISMTFTDYPLHESKELPNKITIPDGTETNEQTPPAETTETNHLLEKSTIMNVVPPVESPATDPSSASTRPVTEEIEREPDQSMFVQMRVIVCRVNHPIFLEFSKNDMVIDRSAPSNGKKLYGEFYFYSDVTVSVYTVKEGFLIGKFHISKTNGRHEIKLTHGQIFVIDVYNRYFHTYSPTKINTGTLTCKIDSMEIADLPDAEIYESIFLELSCNTTTITTKTTTNITHPVVTETLQSTVFTPVDILHIKVFGWTLLKEKRFLGETHLGLSAIPVGNSTADLSIVMPYEESDKKIYHLKSILNLQ
ncbi:hypothetical protein NEOKW01_0674 [Nematocida sp. AWRm80]|nr:hypothetical protein NEOKW01_0674 [Nematocida sp. AWRm80]